jgi:nicotinamidase-related amidase
MSVAGNYRCRMQDLMDTILLINDLINEIVHEDGVYGEKFAPYLFENNVLQNINAAIAYARESNIPVVHAKIAFNNDYIECSTASPIFASVPTLGILRRDTWSTRIHETIDVDSHDKIISKRRISPFYNTDLNALLTANSFSHIVMAGVATDLVISSAVRDAHDRDYLVTVLSDATASISDDVQIHALSLLERLATVTSVTEWATT